MTTPEPTEGAALLREAAARMRELANNATTGDGELLGDHWHHDLAYWSLRYEVIATDEGSIIAEHLDRWTAEHIASWHPAVALAVADWLDYVVDGWEEPVSPGWVWGGQDRALAVARAFLGSDR